MTFMIFEKSILLSERVVFLGYRRGMEKQKGAQNVCMASSMAVWSSMGFSRLWVHALCTVVWTLVLNLWYSTRRQFAGKYAHVA